MAEADNSRALGSRCSDSSELQRFKANGVAASRRLWHTRLAMRPSPNLHPTSITINNIELFAQNALRRKSRNRQSFRQFAGPALCQDRSLSFRRAFVWPPLACVGLCWPVFGGGGRLGLACGRLAVGLGGRAARQPTNCQLVNQAEQK